jgi:hypothetical protein
MGSAGSALERLVRFSHPCPMSRADPIFVHIFWLNAERGRTPEITGGYQPSSGFICWA